MSGNISPVISDHLTQYFILTSFFSDSPPTKYNMIFHDSENFNNQSLHETFRKIKRNQVLQLHQNNVKITFGNYLNTVNTLTYSHAPQKKTKQKTKEVPKKHGLLKEFKNSTVKKNMLFKKYIKCNDCNTNI